MKQIEGRTHRDVRFSQVYWMMGVDTVEDEIAGLVANRLRSMGTMHGDRHTTGDIDAMLYKAAV